MYKVILRKTGDRQTDVRKTANRKTGDQTGDKKILNETDDIKTQKCSVIVIPSYLSESSFHLQENIMFKVILGRQATGRQSTGRQQQEDRQQEDRRQEDRPQADRRQADPG
jgi:hypothetical protein